MKERYLPACLKAEVIAERMVEVDNEIDADWL
jgi:hypothetical protein